ncbi:MAG: xylulose kinase [Planctomycetota bacterium]|nr:MAG: xylulose kinase [Planctomycetota bacterium]
MAADADYVLAIDLGSSGPKVSLVSESGEIAASTSGHTATHTTPDGGSEQDPGQWWNVITECVHRLMSDRPVPVERIVAVSCASQWSVTVPVDREGRHLMNAVHWSDRRGAVHTRRVTDGVIKLSGYGVKRLIHWVRMTGGVPTQSGADALAHILFIRHERPEIYRQTYKFLEPMDYLNFRLTGRAVASYASVFPYLLTDNRYNEGVRYDEKLMDWCGLDRSKLPDLVPVCRVLGRIRPDMAEAWGLSPSTYVIGGTPDRHAAAVGSGALRDFAGHVCLGTTAWLSCHVPFKKTNVISNVATMPSALPGRNMVVAEQGAAGKCLQVFVENWLCRRDELDGAGPPADVYDRVERIAASAPPGCERLLFLPWLNGAGPPTGEAIMRGGFLNQSLVTTRAHALRAIMEGVAFNLRWLRQSVETFVGRPFNGLNFIGGAARSELWCQILADVLDCEIRRMERPEMAISRGAAMVAWVALGRATVDNLPALARVERTFLPVPERRALYKELFAEFLSSYKANRRIFRRLNAR